MIRPDEVKFDVAPKMINLEKHIEEYVDQALLNRFDPEDGLYISYREMIHKCDDYDIRLYLNIGDFLHRLCKRYVEIGWNVEISDSNGWEDARAVHGLFFRGKNKEYKPNWFHILIKNIKEHFRD